VVNYHLTAVMPGYSIAEESPNLLADNENDLAYHIVVGRENGDGRVAEGLEKSDAYWMSAHFKRRDTSEMPSEYHDMLMRLQEYNEDYQKYMGDIENEAWDLLEQAPDLEYPGGARLVHRLYQHADWLAIHFQKRFNQGMVVTHSLAVIMGLVFIIYAEYSSTSFLVYLFLFLFTFGLVFHMIGGRRQWHRKYLDYRALAEGLRVQLYWNLAGVVETRSVVFAYDNFLQKQDVDLGWIRHVMRSASLYRDRNNRPDDRWVKWVTEQWVGEPESSDGQLAYYQRKTEIKAADYRRTTRLGSISLWLGILMAVALAIGSGMLSEVQQNLLLVLMGVLPLFAAVRDAYSHKKAERELIKQYRFMGHVFGNARRLLDSSDDIQFKRRVLKAVGEAALEEHGEWILMHRERPLEHGGL
jgi:heat shock protein HspQ